MDRFDALPSAQRALIFFLVVAGVAGALYFVLIDGAQAEITQAINATANFEKKAATLKKYEDDEPFNALVAQEEELKEQLAANKALLPEKEQIPALITSIKRQADERGLKIMKFDKKDRQPDDYVDIIPVKMEVEGAFPVVVSFFEALAQPGMRMMTVKDLELSAIPFRKQSANVLPGGGAAGDERHIKPGTRRDPTNTEADAGDSVRSSAVLSALDAYSRVIGNWKIEARFTVNAYSYSGKLLDDAERAKRDKTKKRRKRTRR
ncbi:MAG: type 4a pilus biogenesis protein PilO [Deltaproteobacteria bacterium]|nr:type 4a pilus biogenesis protein PilO [Deltaproteobacteria bacterium]MCB9788449.1 type 4a pilus biogenesis protein PilO [Deltaproteobacteria bacterium]